MKKNIDCQNFHSEKLLHANFFTMLRLTGLTLNSWAPKLTQTLHILLITKDYGHILQICISFCVLAVHTLTGAPNENIVQNHLNIASLNVF